MDAYDIEVEIDSVINEARHAIEELVEQLPQLNAADVGLDRRCGNLWVGDGAVFISEANKKIFDYYGGFEYVDSELITVLPGYVRYEREHDQYWDEEEEKYLYQGRIDQIIKAAEKILSQEKG